MSRASKSRPSGFGEPTHAPGVGGEDPGVIVIKGAHPRLYSHDLAPTSEAGRTWGTFSLFAMWMSDVHSVGGYTFAASLFFLGLPGWQLLLAMCVGIGIVNVLMNLIGHPSQKYGIPFPVMARLSFGVMGANMAAMIRGVVGIVWYGVQTYFASKAVEVLALTLAPEFAESYNDNDIYGLTTLAWGSFIFMWFFQLIIFLAGMEAIRTFIDLCGPIVYLVMFLLAGYMINRAGMDVFKMSLHEGEPLKGIAAIGMMLQAAMLIVSYFSALLLNFGDFARFAKSDAAMKSGNFWGLPVNFVTFALIVVIVVGGSQKVFGEAIMDPVLVVEKIGNPLVSVVGSITFIVATMGINIVANFVSPAYDIANLAPEYITFAMGGFITSVCSVLVCPWQFVGSPEAMTLFVAVFGSVLGPMFGIMIADFYITKKQKVILEDLYTLDPKGSLYFSGGWNPKALWAMLIAGGVAVGLAIGGGFRGKFGIPEDFPDVKDWGWLIGSSLGALVYVVCMPSASGAPEKPPLV